MTSYKEKSIKHDVNANGNDLDPEIYNQCLLISHHSSGNLKWLSKPTINIINAQDREVLNPRLSPIFVFQSHLLLSLW